MLCQAGTVRLFNGETYEAKIDLDNNGISTTRDKGPSTRVDLNNVIEIIFGKTPSTVSCPPGVLLINGSFIPGTPPDLDEPNAKMGNPPLTFPITSIARMVFSATPFDKVLQSSNGRTGIILPNGDFFVGTFDGIKDKRFVAVNSPLFGPQRFQKTTLSVLVLREVQAPPTRFEVIAKDKRFLVDDLKVDGGGATLRDTVVGNVKIETKDLVAIRAGSSRWQSVASSKPTMVDAPKGTDATEAVRVQAAAEPPASEPPSVFTAAQTGVSYSVPNGLNFFSCRVEAPKETPPGIRIAFAVYGDGRLLSRSPFLAAGDVPQSLRVSLGTARILTLRVEPAKPGPATVFGKWVDPLLLHP